MRRLMRTSRVLYFSLTAVLCVGAFAVSRGNEAAAKSAAVVADKAFLGRWDLTLSTQEGNKPSWLDLTEKDGKLEATYVGRWGNARPLPKAEIKDGTLTFVSPKDEEGLKEDMVFSGKLNAANHTLHGTVNGTDGQHWQWEGSRAPKLAAPKDVKWGKAVTLFDGKTLNGWTYLPPNGKPEWTVKDGAIVKPSNAPELVNDKKFKDFKLHIEFNIGDEANSGVYLRGRYEAQIENESDNEPPNRHLAGIYGFLAPFPTPPRKPNQWQTYDITLLGRYVTVVLNGITVIDNKEIPGITGGALNSAEGTPGPFYLQGGEKGTVMFRNIVVTPAVD